jgi:Tfp pilus assembly protein PilN
MIRINLLKPEKKEVREEAIGLPSEVKARKKTPLAGLIIILALIAVAALYYFQNNAIKQERDLLEQAQQEKEELEFVSAALEELKQQKDLLNRKINLINRLKARQVIAVRIMDELSKNIPGWVWLTETSYDDQEIKIEGRALSNNLIADYVYSLENSPHLSSVRIISITQKSAQTNRYLEFSLTARYDLPPELTAPEETNEGGQQ